MSESLDESYHQCSMCAWPMHHHSIEGTLHFHRRHDGSVEVRMMRREKDHGWVIVHEQIIDAGHWASTVLAMTEFDERPNDWHPFMDHHQGRCDLLEAAKLLATYRGVLTTIATAGGPHFDAISYAKDFLAREAPATRAVRQKQ